jgi:ferredoxin-NADP reductase
MKYTMTKEVAIKHTEFITHNVLHFKTEKPRDYDFTPGQATEVSLGKEGWRDEKRPFTFTSLPADLFWNLQLRCILPTMALPGNSQGWPKEIS